MAKSKLNKAERLDEELRIIAYLRMLNRVDKISSRVVRRECRIKTPNNSSAWTSLWKRITKATGRVIKGRSFYVF